MSLRQTAAHSLMTMVRPVVGGWGGATHPATAVRPVRGSSRALMERPHVPDMHEMGVNRLAHSVTGVAALWQLFGRVSRDEILLARLGDEIVRAMSSQGKSQTAVES